MDLPSALVGDEEKRFVTNCPRCRRELHRYVTFPQRDPYHHESYRATMDRQKHVKDLIQPGESGFQTYYKKSWDDMQESARKYEEKEAKEKAERDEFYKKMAYSGADRQAAKATIEAEEKLKHGGYTK